MSYQTYTTDAIVCGSRERGAADRTFWLFTRDAGMVVARAKSVREGRSKLRYSLQDFSLLTVSLVRGKHEWQIVGAEPYDNIYFACASRDARAAVLRAIRLLRRLVPGEEMFSALFSVTVDGVHHLRNLKHKDTDVESLFALRVLYKLGYVSPERGVRELAEDTDFARARDILKESALGPKIRTIVDEALTVSHL